MRGRSKRGFVALKMCTSVVLLLVACAACSKLTSDGGPNTPGGGSTNPVNSNAPTANSNASPNSNNPVTEQAPPSGEGVPTSWDQNASLLKSAEGETRTFVCSPGGTAHTVWGSDIYTADSSICTAGVHAGLITLEKGGT